MQVLYDNASRYDHVYMFTFQYKDEDCPLFVRESNPDKPFPDDFKFTSQYNRAMKEYNKKVEGGRPKTRKTEEEFRARYKFANFKTNRTTDTVQQIEWRGKTYDVAASLDAKEISKLIKQFRTECERLAKDDEDYDVKFKYYVIGEYGPQTARPHHHGLFYGLNQKTAHLLSDIWQRHHGRVVFKELVRNMKSFTNSAMYVANYLHKAQFEPRCVKEKVCQHGRVQCSTGLVVLTQTEKDYYLGVDLGLGKYDPKWKYTPSAIERVYNRLKRTCGNKTYKLSDKYRKQLFYEKKKKTSAKTGNVYTAFVPTPLQDEITRFIQLRILSDFDAEFECLASYDTPKIGADAFLEIKAREKECTVARRESAQRRLHKVVTKSKF